MRSASRRALPWGRPSEWQCTRLCRTRHSSWGESHRCWQVPLAWLADRVGRTAVMLACFAVTGGVLWALHQGLPLPAMAACLFLAGAYSGAFYPLGLAVLGERLPTLAIPRARACFLAINC